MQAFTTGARAVSQDQWAEHLTQFRTYQTESVFRSGYSVMFSKLSADGPRGLRGCVVAEVHYLPNQTREYFIV